MKDFFVFASTSSAKSQATACASMHDQSMAQRYLQHSSSLAVLCKIDHLLLRGSSLRVGKSKLMLATFGMGDESGRSCRRCRAMDMKRSEGAELVASRLGRKCRFFLGAVTPIVSISPSAVATPPRPFWLLLLPAAGDSSCRVLSCNH